MSGEVIVNDLVAKKIVLMIADNPGRMWRAGEVQMSGDREEKSLPTKSPSPPTSTGPYIT